MFLPQNYEVPKSDGKYLKLEKGQNRFRVVSSAVVGYEYWTDKNKPVRLKTIPKISPEDMREDSKIKHFWAFVVIDRKDGQIKIAEITQSSIMQAVEPLLVSEEWGDPKGYDITISRTGDKLDTEYTVQPSPHKELTAEEKTLASETPVNLEALFSGDNPFDKTGKQDEIVDIPEEDIKSEDINF